MDEETSSIKTASKSLLRQWFFNPFRFIAGVKALFLGTAIIVITSLIGSMSNTHFDGVLDVHPGPQVPMWMFLAEGIIDWGCMAGALVICAFFVSRSSFRVIDVAGTQALARWPYLVAAVATLLMRFTTYGRNLSSTLLSDPLSLTTQKGAMLFLGLLGIVIMLMCVWMVALMYRAYSVSCNIKGPRAIGSFIGGILAAEILSKVILWRLLV